MHHVFIVTEQVNACDITSGMKKRKVEVVGAADLSDKDRSKRLASLSKKAITAMKKAAHNDKKKPYSEIAKVFHATTRFLFLAPWVPL